jgi:hypothetical protein
MFSRPLVHTAHETCECGAEIRVSSAFAMTVTLQLDAFRAAHAACRVYQSRETDQPKET